MAFGRIPGTNTMGRSRTDSDGAISWNETSAPATKALAVTPHDSNALTDGCAALFVGTTGNITMRGLDGATDQVWKNIPSGSVLPFAAQYIRATGTTAADILALY